MTEPLPSRPLGLDESIVKWESPADRDRYTHGRARIAATRVLGPSRTELVAQISKGSRPQGGLRCSKR